MKLRLCRMFVAHGYAALLGLTSLSTLAHAADDVQISNAWVRATVPGQPVAAAYLELSAKRPLKWVEVSSSVSASGEIHTMIEEQGIMKMRALDGVDVRPGEPVVLAPGGMHVMLFGLKQPLRDGSKAELKLRFVRPDGTAFTQSIQVPVRDGATEPSHDKHEH